MNGEYSSFLELMHYFNFEFNIYIVLLSIIVINCFKAVTNYRKFVKGSEEVAFDISSIIISILCEIAFLNAFMFQGVVADISTTAGEAWYSKVLVVSILSFLAFAVQIFFTGRLVKASK